MKIDELIRKQCPQGVEKVKLEKIIRVEAGKRSRTDHVEGGKYPILSSSKDTFLVDDYDYDETAIIIPRVGSEGKTYHFIQGKYSLHNNAFRIRANDDSFSPKFLYYALCQGFEKFLEDKQNTGMISSIRKSMVKDFRVPAPPLTSNRRSLTPLTPLLV